MPEKKLKFGTQSNPPFMEGDVIKASCDASFYITDPYNVTRVTMVLSRGNESIMERVVNTKTNILNDIEIAAEITLTNPRLVTEKG